VRAAVLFAGAAIAGPALAQPLTREELQQALAQRDREIAALEKRVDELEAQGHPAAAAGAAIQTLPASTGPAPAQSAAAKSSSSDDQVALQALSRGLVQRGLLLLPEWSAEIAPAVGYIHSQQQGLILVDTPEGISTVSDQRQRDDDIQPSISARLGLPWQSQVQVSVPFDWRRTESALGDNTEVAHTAAHVGDLSLEFSHQFVVEDTAGWRPDLIAAVGWRAPTGLNQYKAEVAGVANGSGSNAVTGRLTALKTIDPLVVFSTVSYAHNFSYPESVGRVTEGDTADWDLGALLAVNPDTSLSFGFDQQFRFVTRVNGAKIAGSDGVAASAQLGLDQVINAHTLLDVTVSLGITKDAPDYAVMVSLPIRFR
jgi:hypothetical protein